ncbi:uncharacterized protein K452DRAFT_351491 [Aplosporella prunicola CBS 121167]|uniref:Peptidase M20 dimerisation domain-containing protein n=1 Tax=Aplosporella prunicola CBS 121167 TaxID=1176127 RepID=A0A6A6BAX3_9PEZI|nr:uncharacterized protein K452DRAFT_351491 [Aplosporella prunicola CBS 121167]KAF2141369.1 hypothetical protein K452DRAFT_351491 [Aplosporella prunicola CBS 121167]
MSLAAGRFYSATRRQACGTWLRPYSAALTSKPILQSALRRSFVYSARCNSHTLDMSDKDLAKLKVNQARLMEDLHHTCSFGTGERWGKQSTETGMHRLSLTDDDKQARDWFVATTKALGCHVTVDAVGNIFAVRPGRREGPPTFTGSHLDTQPTGGRYDGILGIISGVEMLKVLSDSWVETEFPVGVVNWTNEEGARFPNSMMASGVWAGTIPLDSAHNLQEVGGGTATVKSELERIGYLGQTPASYEATPMAAHFELHIEQGPVLEAEKTRIGVVEGVQAYRWFTVDVGGRDCHTGTTPFKARSDALLTASKLILHSHRLATAHSALASTGILTLTPGSTNTVPNHVRFSLDIRSPSDDTLDALEAALKADFAAIAEGRPTPLRKGVKGVKEGLGSVLDVNDGCTKGKPCDVTWRTDSVSPAIRFHEDTIQCVRDAAAAAGLATRDLTSGAGHDSVYTSRRCPTSMIFIPCREGISHNPTEYATPEDCAAGAQVLLSSVLAYDRLRSKRRVTWAQEERHV